jgi:hypothetical protein
MLGVEGPDVEVLDAVLPVHVVQGSALAQGSAQQAAGIAARTVRVALEEFGFGLGSQRGEAQKVTYVDSGQRPIHVLGHAAILPPKLPDRCAATTSDMSAPVVPTAGRCMKLDVHSSEPTTRLKNVFHSDSEQRDNFLARLFGIFSEHLVSTWCDCPEAPYLNIGRPTLRQPGQSRAGVDNRRSTRSPLAPSGNTPA